MNDYYKNLPRKYMGSGALFFDKEGRVLILKPTYKEGWEIPGGNVDENESPWQTCVRECMEEIGITPKRQRLLSLDYFHNIDDRGDRIMFVFDGGELEDNEIAQIILQKSEIAEHRLVTVEEALGLLGEKLRRRLTASVQARANNTTAYLEHGIEV